MSGRRAAFLDVGTNTILCLIVEFHDGGGFTVLEDLAEIARLGQGVDKTREISTAGEARSTAVLRAYLSRCAELDVKEITAVGTSALRDARNSAAVLQRWRQQLGLDVRVISGDEEAACSFLAARCGLALGDAELLVIDIGGGSTEFIRGSAAGMTEAVSLDVGSVRLTERFVRSDPPTVDECACMSAEIDRLLTPLVNGWRAVLPRLTLVGIAATFTTLVAVKKNLACYVSAEVHGSRIEPTDVRRQIELYRSRTNSERQAIPGLHPQRADVILAGALLVERIMSGFAAPHVIVSDQGVRYGLLHRRRAELRDGDALA